MPQLVTRTLALGLVLAACGGGDKKNNNTPDAPMQQQIDASPDAPARTCASDQVANTDFRAYDAQNNVIVFGADGGDPGDGNAVKLSFEFYGGIEPSLMGTFDLTQGKQNNYATCAICVRAYSQDAQGNLIKEFFQSGGSVTLSEDPLTNQHLVATFSNLQLEEVTIDRNNGFTSTPVANGLCASYGSPSIDHDKVPNAWTCQHPAWEDGTNCDCMCGIVDPDCNASPTQTVNGCTNAQPVCSSGTCAAVAANDVCGSAITLTLGTAVQGTTVGAYNNYSNGLEGQTCTGFHQAGADVAYKVTLTANTQYTVTLSGLDATFDGSVSLLGPGAASQCDPDPIATCVAGSDAGAEGADETFTYTPTTTGDYYVLVDSFYAAESGAFTLKVE
jgi:hypothetical protein